MFKKIQNKQKLPESFLYCILYNLYRFFQGIFQKMVKNETQFMKCTLWIILKKNLRAIQLNGCGFWNLSTTNILFSYFCISVSYTTDKEISILTFTPCPELKCFFPPTCIHFNGITLMVFSQTFKTLSESD